MFRKSLCLCGVLLLFFVSIASAQDEEEYKEACELDLFNEQIDGLIADYLATRQIDTSTDGALASVNALTSQLEDAYQTCLQLQREARSEELESLLQKLQDGGYIIYVRHTHTDRVGMGDTERENCESERNLSTRGRIEAQAIKVAYDSLQLPIEEIITTELCRTRDTTDLAFGEPTQIILRSELEQTLADVITIQPPANMNTIIVAHIGTINRNFGLPIPFDEGDSYVFLPKGDDGFELVGRISLLDWEWLAEINTD